MVFDKNNHYQETAAQLRQKIKQYKKRPAYLVPYLKTRGLLPQGETKDGAPGEKDEEKQEAPAEKKTKWIIDPKYPFQIQKYKITVSYLVPNFSGLSSMITVIS